MDTDELPPSIDGTQNPSFCYTTIVERWPKIVTKVIDQLHQFQPEAVKRYGEEGDKDVKHVISKLAEMRYLMGTNKPLTDMINGTDAEIWNSQLDTYRNEVGESNVTWFKMPWLFVECYLYRKIYEFFTGTTNLRDYDPFQNEKQRSYMESPIHMISIGAELMAFLEKDSDTETLRKVLHRFFQIALWGNKCDLSLSGGDPHNLSDTIFQELDSLRPSILVNDLEDVCDNCLLKPCGTSNRIDIVMDNSGLEVFTDFCLADLMISKKLASKIVFYGKAIPWFVSDVTQKDFAWVINQLMRSYDPVLSKLGARWQKFVTDGLFVFEAHPFWTYGVPYCEMKPMAPQLYEELSQAKLVIFKGDLNYRKLVGDRLWPLSTPFEKAVRGFEPTNFVSLRTLKAETVVGLPPAAIETINKQFKKGDKSWMVTGDYAVIQMLRVSGGA